MSTISTLPSLSALSSATYRTKSASPATSQVQGASTASASDPTSAPSAAVTTTPTVTQIVNNISVSHQNILNIISGLNKGTSTIGDLFAAIRQATSVANPTITNPGNGPLLAAPKTPAAPASNKAAGNDAVLKANQIHTPKPTDVGTPVVPTEISHPLVPGNPVDPTTPATPATPTVPATGSIPAPTPSNDPGVPTPTQGSKNTVQQVSSSIQNILSVVNGLHNGTASIDDLFAAIRAATQAANPQTNSGNDPLQGGPSLSPKTTDAAQQTPSASGAASTATAQANPALPAALPAGLLVDQAA